MTFKQATKYCSNLNGFKYNLNIYLKSAYFA